MSFLVISTSLNPNSQSALLANEAYIYTLSKKKESTLIDLRDYDLPFCNGHEQSCYEDPAVLEIHTKIEQVQGVLIASPIHNYGVAASCKNLFELTSHSHKNILSGTCWQNKVVAYMGFSGSPRSLLAPFPFLNAMFIDASIILTPPIFMASREDMSDGGLKSASLERAHATIDRWHTLTEQMTHKKKG